MGLTTRLLPFICDMSVTYNCAGVHGRVSSPDINDTMSAFAFDKGPQQSNKRNGSRHC